MNVPIAAVAIAASLFLMPESRDPESRPLDILGTVLSMGAVSALILSIIEGPEWGIASPKLAITVAAAVAFGLGFVMRERQTEYPLLDFSLFRRPGFSTGLAAVNLAFFAMVGFIFGLTQYLQFVQGHDPLAAGLRFAPAAVGLTIGAIASEELAGRLGTRKVVLSGLVILTGVLPVVLFWNIDSSYWIIGPVLLAIGLGTGAVFAAAAGSVMGAVEEAKADVGSAMNDVSQMLAGALSIAVVGSIMYAIYRARLGDALDALPQGVADAARDSIGAAVKVAAQLPPEEGLALSTAARTAFTDAFGISVVLGAGFSLVGGLLIAKFMPASHPAGHGAHGSGHEAVETPTSPTMPLHPNNHPTGETHARHV